MQIALATANATGRGIWLTSPSSGPFEVNGNQLTGVDVPAAVRTDPFAYAGREAVCAPGREPRSTAGHRHERPVDPHPRRVDRPHRRR